MAESAFYDCVEGSETSSSEESEDCDTTYQFLNHFLSSENCFSNIDVPVRASRADVMIMLLKYAITTRAAKSHVEMLFKLVNNIFVTPILPDTSYFIEKMFNPDIGTKLHAICPQCKSYGGEINLAQAKNTVCKCRECSNVIDVSNLNKSGFFFTFHIKRDIKNVIEKNMISYNEIMTENRRNNKTIKDIYDGRKYKELKKKLKKIDCNYFATAIFNSDGSPIFSSSTLSVWPIQILINELPFEERMKNVILSGLWFGKGKPNMNIFMGAFADHLNDLSENGIECDILGQNRCIKFYCICCCVDSVARAPMQGLTQFNGNYGCNWCLHPGEWSKKYHFMTYPALSSKVEVRTEDQALRDIEEFVNADIRSKKKNKDIGHGFKYKASITKLQYFDLIEGFTVDYMHNIALGVARQFAKYWFQSKSRGKNKKKYAITPKQFKDIDDIILKLTPHSQIGRLTRSLHERKYWKSREWESWTLYYSVPILATVLPEEYVQHWNLLVEALYILLQENITIVELNRSSELLHEFVGECNNLYGSKCMTFNLHQLLHLPSSVFNWGPLWAHNGYPFENGNGEIVKTIHAANGMAHQVQRYVSYQSSLSYLLSLKKYTNYSEFIPQFLDKLDNKTKYTIKKKTCRYMGKSFIPFQNVASFNDIQLNNCLAFNRIVMKKCTYKTKTSKRSNNSFALLKNGAYIQCVVFLYDPAEGKELLIARKVETENAYNTIKKIVTVNEEMFATEVENLCHPCIVIKVEKNDFISAVPNNYHCN